MLIRIVSQSNMKYDAIIKSGVTVGKRYEIPVSSEWCRHGR